SGVRVDLGCLEVVLCFKDGMPAEEIDRIRTDNKAADARGGDLGIVEHRLGLRVFCPAPAPEDDDAAKREDGPALTAEGLAARADFPVSKAGKPGHDDRRAEQGPHYGLGADK